MLDLGAAMDYGASRLSGAEWTVLPVDNGTAPEIKTQTVVEDGRTYLTVQIIDSDGDLRTTAYASGTWTVEQFHGGRVGRTFSLSGNGTARFSVGRSGTYTFYAVDSVGMVFLNGSGQPGFTLGCPFIFRQYWKIRSSSADHRLVSQPSPSR